MCGWQGNPWNNKLDFMTSRSITDHEIIQLILHGVNIRKEIRQRISFHIHQSRMVLYSCVKRTKLWLIESKATQKPLLVP